MVCENTLKVKHLPKDLSEDEIEDLLKHFGATQVKVITSKSKEKSTAFAQFESKELAKSVLLRLHQISILNSILCVQYAEHDLDSGNSTKNIESSNVSSKKYFSTFINKLNAWNSAVSFNQPPPPFLKYAYPKPNRATINNIAHALASVPKFYTQVLHLMNKMNLPPPFSDIPDPPQTAIRQQIPPPVQNVMPKPETTEPHAESSESELESDPEREKTEDTSCTKRKLPQKRVIKRPKFIKPMTQPASSKIAEKAEDVFEKVNLISQKKIEVKVSADALQKTNESDRKENTTETSETDKNDEKELESGVTVITDEDLASNRIPVKDLSVLPVFKNYHAGVPTSRLYIKNIAKSVELSDLELIYNRYKGECENSQFNIRLLQEGRMKGQAFITLDSVEIALKALEETNGFIFKDKPLVVVYAKIKK